MRMIPRRPRAIPVPVLRTCGLFHVPILPANSQLELRVYLSNFERHAASADITVNEEDQGSKIAGFRTSLLVRSMGTAKQRIGVTEKKGHIIEVELTLSSDLVKPSLDLVQIGTEDGSERSVLFLPPSAFMGLQAHGASPTS